MYGIGVAATLPGHEPLPLAPRHPALHPGFGLALEVGDGRVAAADPQPGLMHRSAEKLFESRDWRQGLALADRHDWLSSISSEIGMALAYEAALGITPPPRATWIRPLLAEINRITVALAVLAPVAGSARASAEGLRERLVALQESMTGARMHPAFCRIGGVAADVDVETLEAHVELLKDVSRSLPHVTEGVATYADGLSEVGVLTRDEAIAWGLSGPVARASGWDRDLRRDDPYLAYAEVPDVLAVPLRTAGDVPSRYAVLAEQILVSVAIALACVDELRSVPDGAIDLPLPKVIRIPEGTTYVAMEGPIGISGCLLVGDGDKYPLRMKIRSASFATLQALGSALIGTREDQVADVVMSMPVVLGDVDR
jgi:NADH-quinone oxidoreductase subunit D